MIVFLNGRFVPEEQAVLSVFDRGFLYGDGLFEVMRVCQGRCFRWEQHLERLRGGAEVLNIKLPFPESELSVFAEQLIARNKLPEALLRLTLSRGVGPRGYSPRGADIPSLVMSLHPVPAIDPRREVRWRLITASVRLPANEGLAQFKTCNKLPQILARAEADAAGAEEALLVNTDGHIVEASSSNLFWIDQGVVCTPPLASGILAGVTRAVVMELCGKLGFPSREASVAPALLQRVEGVFLSLSTVGVADAASLDGQSLSQSPLVQQLRVAYADLLDTETRS